MNIECWISEYYPYDLRLWALFGSTFTYGCCCRICVLLLVLGYTTTMLHAQWITRMCQRNTTHATNTPHRYKNNTVNVYTKVMPLLQGMMWLNHLYHEKHRKWSRNTHEETTFVTIQMAAPVGTNLNVNGYDILQKTTKSQKTFMNSLTKVACLIETIKFSRALAM